MTSCTETRKPLIALTMGDVTGIGPEVVARAATDAQVLEWCDLVVIGDPVVLDRALQCTQQNTAVNVVHSLQTLRSQQQSNSVNCWNPSSENVAGVPVGSIDPRAGQAAYDWLIAATDAALNQEIDAIVTAPLNKAALNAAGLHYPGHTEILAERCGVNDFAMMLYLPVGDIVKSPHGFGVAHVTLHTSIASVPGLLSTNAIQEKIGLVDRFLKQLGCESPHVGVCALNPHGGEQGLFGNEESTLIQPAVEQAQAIGINAFGPLPADTLLQQAIGGKFDGVVAMYHDQGHIALKLIGFNRAVNVTLGLPIIRTSPSHGTAFDIAWTGQADASGMRAAIKVAAALANRQRLK